MNRLFYTVLWHLGLPLIAARLVYRARKQPEYLQHIAERFGATPVSGTRPCIWIHAVSVGETRAAQPLIKALLAQYPEYDIRLTHMTPTGRATASELFGKEARVISSYLPYDFPWAQERFLRRTRPSLGIIMETEVWPNLLHCAAKACIPMLLANARLSARSARGYQRLGMLARQSFARFNRISAQTDADAERLKACGAEHIEVCGNIKFDVDLADALLQRGDEFRRAAGNRPVVLAAATREGEEAPLLAAFKQQLSVDTLLVVVPRHPQRFDEVAREIERQGLTLQRRSEGLALAPQTNVWLGDSMGEMLAYYRMCDIAVIGGSWQALGGQNLIEACAVGRPVLIGPHTFNFTEAANKAIEAGAALRCLDLDEALKQCRLLLQDGDKRAGMGEAGRAFAAANRGATARTTAIIAALLTP